MLSPTRVIGHREYGNRPPGGWPGRKSDPTYDMNWRRARVAAFTPHGDDMPLTIQEMDAIADRAAARVWAYVLGERDGLGPAGAVDWLRHAAIAASAAADEKRVSQSVWNQTPPGTEGAWPVHRLAGVDEKTGTTEQLVRDLLQEVKALREEVAALRPPV